jgi:hypothetical protein
MEASFSRSRLEIQNLQAEISLLNKRFKDTNSTVKQKIESLDHFSRELHSFAH